MPVLLAAEPHGGPSLQSSPGRTRLQHVRAAARWVSLRLVCRPSAVGWGGVGPLVHSVCRYFNRCDSVSGFGFSN